MRRRAVEAASSVTRRNATDVDEAALAALLDAVRSGAVHPDDAVAGCAACPSPISASPGSTTTAPCARACPRPCTGRARRPSSAPPSSAELLDGGASPVLLTRAADDQAAAALARQPGRRAARHHASCGGRRPARPERVRGRHRRHRRPAGGRRVRHRARGPRLRARSGSPTSAWPASTACSPRPTRWPPPTPSSSSPAWRARWPAWSAASPRRPVVAVPTSVGYGASLEGVTALLAMLASCAAGLTVVGIDNGFGAACAVAPDAASEPTA